jgi:hypothetical protein
MARLQRGQRRRLHVETQPALALAVVRTVALEAAVREDRLDVEVEVDPVGHAGDRRRRRSAAGGGSADDREQECCASRQGGGPAR